MTPTSARGGAAPDAANIASAGADVASAGAAPDAAAGVSDARARRAAVDPQRSILLQAPAGSGKTTVLVERFLTLLLTVDEVEEVLAITFTRKAAGEMRERVLRALRIADTELSRRVLARSRERGWNLLENPARLRILTIDALNRWLASRLPLNTAGAAELAISDDPEGLYALAAHRAVVDAESSSHLAHDLDLIYERLDNDRARLERMIALMLPKRTHWLPRLLAAGAEGTQGGDEAGRVPGTGGGGASETELLARVNESLAVLTEAALESARRFFPATLVREGGRIAAGAAAHRERAGHPDDGIWSSWSTAPDAEPGLAQWRALAGLALKGDKDWRRQHTVREGFPPHDRALKQDVSRWLRELQAIERAQDMLRMVDELPDAALGALDSAVLAALTRLLILAAGELELVFGEVQRVDYPHLSGAARQSLAEEGAPTDLALRLGESIRHILVDEFQDTSIDQFVLLEQLTASWSPGDARTLFVVGDPMQSIYLFRDAEVGLFLRARDRGIGGVQLEPLYLEQNFRSAPSLIAWTNQSFARLFPAHEDQTAGAVRFLPALTGRADEPGTQVAAHRVPEDEQAHAAAVAGHIRALRAASPGESVAVLVLAKSHAEAVVRELEARGVPCEAVDLIMLRDVAVVRDLSALARALDSLADRTAWLAILRAPWCGLSLIELTQLLDGLDPTALVRDALHDAARIERLAPDARSRLGRLLEAIEPVLVQGERVPLIERVERAWLRLGGPSCVPSRELPAAEAFFVTVGRWAAAPEWTGPLSLDARLARLHAPQRPEPGAVQFMTVHRAKGLEFDHVIVPFLDRPTRREASPLVRFIEVPGPRGEPCMLIAPRQSVSDKRADRLNQYLRRLATAREQHERVRLMYVAATRARRSLHWFAGIADGAQPRVGSALRVLWPALEDAFLSQPQPEEPVEDLSAAPPIYYRLRTNARLPAAPPDVSWEGIGVASYEPPRHGESSVDALIRQQLLRGVADPSAERLARQLRRAGIAAEAIEAQTAEVLAAVHAAARHPLIGAWCFDAALARECAVELTGLIHGKLTSVCIDIAVVDAQGMRWVVRIAGGKEGSGADLAAQRELEQWRTLARGAFGGSVRGAVYYPRAQTRLLS